MRAIIIRREGRRKREDNASKARRMARQDECQSARMLPRTQLKSVAGRAGGVLPPSKKVAAHAAWRKSRKATGDNITNSGQRDRFYQRLGSLQSRLQPCGAALQGRTVTNRRS